MFPARSTSGRCSVGSCRENVMNRPKIYVEPDSSRKIAAFLGCLHETRVDLVGETSLVSRPDLRNAEVHCAGDAIVLHDLLSGNVGSFCSQFAAQGRIDQGNPVRASLRLVSRNLHPTVRTLDQAGPSFSPLAPSSGLPLLCHHRCLLLSPISIGPYNGFVRGSKEEEISEEKWYLHAENVASVIPSSPCRRHAQSGVKYAGDGRCWSRYS